MNIRIFNKLDAGVYTVSLFTEAWSQGDADLMAGYGEPTVNMFGSFEDETGYVSFTLPDSYKRIMTESPFTWRFDSRDYADAEDRAELWKVTMIDRITAAVQVLRAQADTFTREQVVTV